MELNVIFGILLAGILSNNTALLHFLGPGAVIENERTTKQSVLLGLGSMLVMVIATAITWPLNKYVLETVPYLQTMAFVFVVLLVVETLHMVARKLLDNYCHANFVKFAINGAVLGLCIHNTELSFVEAIVTAVAVGLGFMLTMTLFARLHNSLDESEVPASFRGLPIALLTAGMITLALMALNF